MIGPVVRIQGVAHVLVMERPCDGCLYTPNRLVSVARAREIIREVRAKQCDFYCHKGNMVGGINVICRSNATEHPSPLVQIATRLRGIFDVPEGGVEALAKTVRAEARRAKREMRKRV